MPRYLIAHDIGTSGNKATLFTVEGEMVKSVISTYSTDYFHNNWVEQDPNDWWRAVCTCSKSLLEGLDNRDVLAVSFSGQMMGCVCVDKNGKPLRRAIIWADMRASKEAKKIADKIPKDRFYRITGHRISSSYSLEKLMWIKSNEPEIYENTYKMLNAKDFIVHKLTGRFLTDYSDASGTNAFDLNRFCWSEEIIEASGIEFNKFPEVVESTYIAGSVTADAAEACGLAAGTRVVIGGGDGVCASVGAGSVYKGMTYCCLGSSSWICTTTRKPIFDDQFRIFTWAHIVPGLVAPCGTMQSAGISFEWLKNEICSWETEMGKASGVSPYQLINEQIGQSSPGANGLLFLPYLMGERSPRWNENARGAFIGLKMEHKRADLLRSVVEGIGMNLNVILEIFKKDIPIGELTVIGGLAKGDIQRQILADIFNTKILRLNYLEEATSIGAAVTAGVAVGVLKGFEEVQRFVCINAENKPIAKNIERYQRLQPLFNKAYFDLIELFDELAKV